MAKTVAEVAEIVRSLRCMEVVLGWLGGEGESPGIRRSSRLLPCWMFMVEVWRYIQIEQNQGKMVNMTVVYIQKAEI